MAVEFRDLYSDPFRLPEMTGCYDIQTAGMSVKGVMTNTPAVDAYRGAGRPEANYVIERLMDHIAAELGLIASPSAKRI